MEGNYPQFEYTEEEKNREVRAQKFLERIVEFENKQKGKGRDVIEHVASQLEQTASLAENVPDRLAEKVYRFLSDAYYVYAEDPERTVDEQILDEIDAGTHADLSSYQQVLKQLAGNKFGERLR